MDNIRATLYTLFANQNGNEVIDSIYRLNTDKRSDKYVEKDSFCRFFREKYNMYSYDRINEIYKILITNWMREYKTPGGLTSFATDSIFNVLLNYSNEVLIEKGQMPVCQYEQLFRWHLLVSELGEDLFTTSFLAASDNTLHINRNIFSWNHCIEHDNAMLNHIFDKSTADLHFHLKGSSINFELNWLSLMNSISMRNKEFEEFKKRQNPSIIISENGIEMDDLYTSISKACLIRYLLFGKLSGYFINNEEESRIWELLKPGNKWHDITSYLEPKLNTIRYSMGKRYGKYNVDYAIPKNLTYSEMTDQEKYRNTILSGERWIMYNMFKKIYSSDKEFEQYSTLFYAYLIEKNRLRHELIQLNKKVGFANFAQYEKRKEWFIKDGSVYKILIVHQAIHNSIKSKKNNYLEARITPKNNVRELCRSIQTTDSNVFDKNFLIPQIKTLQAFEIERSGYLIKTNNYHYVLHFIKSKDHKLSKNLQGLVPRNYTLRSQIKKQTLAIAGVRNYNNKYSMRIVGVDAANTEIGCRPEVFAQAYRYLKYHPTKKTQEYFMNTMQSDLGFTYHVGEDFMDLADGLRAIDEAINFLNLGNGDRLGHALALGINSEEYYTKANYTVVMSKQDFLDNVVWIWRKIRNCKISAAYPLIYQLEQWYETLFREVYGNIGYTFQSGTIPTIYTYFQSWLLRGDNPHPYSIDKIKEGEYGFDQYALNEYTKEIIDARCNNEARALYYFYHFDERVKEKGRKSDQWKVDQLYQFAIKEIQENMCQQIEKAHICIETNPTSNFHIASLKNYKSHPIFQFFNHGINTIHTSSNISVSINTDDLGIFSTCIEREFSLIVLALEKNLDVKNNPRQIYDWIDRIREMGFEQRFYK